MAPLPTPHCLSEHVIEIHKRPMIDKVVARCHGLGLQATSTGGAHVAIMGCARKVAMGSAYSLKQFNAYTWIVTVNHAEPEKP